MNDNFFFRLNVLIFFFSFTSSCYFISFSILTRFYQLFPSGSGRIRVIWSDPDPYQEALIWIRVAPKDYSGKKSVFFKKFYFFVTFRPVSEYIIHIVYKL